MRHHSNLIYALFVAIGLVLFLVAYISKTIFNIALLGDIVKDVGVVVLSLALVDRLWKAVGGDPLSAEIDELKAISRLHQDASITGLVGVYPSAVNIDQTLWLDLIKSAKTSIDISSHTQFDFVNRQDLLREIINRAKDGVKIRLVINSGSNKALEYTGYSPMLIDTMHKQMEHTWLQFQETISSLPTDILPNLKIVRLQNETLFNGIRRFDEKNVCSSLYVFR